MKLDLKEWLNKITSRKPVFEYVGNMSSYVFNSSWTATDDGFAIVRATWDTTGAFGYWYINDTTDNLQVCNLGGTSNGTTLSAMIPIIKGHSYANVGSDHVYYAFFHFYKMKWGGVLHSSILKAYRRFASSKGGGVDEGDCKGTDCESLTAIIWGKSYRPKRRENGKDLLRKLQSDNKWCRLPLPRSVPIYDKKHRLFGGISECDKRFKCRRCNCPSRSDKGNYRGGASTCHYRLQQHRVGKSRNNYNLRITPERGCAV